MAASTFRATGIPVWDQAGQGPAQSWVVTHLWLHQYQSAYQSTQEGGPPFSKGPKSCQIIFQPFDASSLPSPSRGLRPKQGLSNEESEDGGRHTETE
jgi:hypothetical protein